jgi:DNA-3-methyladenine glycosylase
LSLAAYGADDPFSEQPGHLPPQLPRLRREELLADAVSSARFLLGKVLIRDDGGVRLAARIVETEAYAGPEDRASHARAGRTPRTAVMFGPPGHAYVYLVYGLHHCLNVVCGPEGEAAAVLIRAVEPLAGVARMRERRGPSGGPDLRLAAGPARTCQALGIERELSGLDLLSDERLWLAHDPACAVTAEDIVSGPRIGVDYAGPDWGPRLWRFGLAGSAALSKPFEGPR